MKIGEYVSQFLEQGEVEYLPTQSLRCQLAAAEVPYKPGIYLIYGKSKDVERLVYIGKAGTVNTNGDWQQQGLRRRLCAKQDDMPRQVYFRQKLREGEFDRLVIHWVATMDPNGVLPAKAEADLLQLYYNEHGKLPPWNRSF